jgi:tetratricopeptide (TPR) repeat protein
MFLQFQGSGSDRLKLRELYERLVARWHPQTQNEQNLFADALKAIGDEQQFLNQSREALSRYDEALRIYRDVGDRLGEANTLLGLGSLQDGPEPAMEYFSAAQELFVQIGDRYSQGQNLLMYIAPAQWQLENRNGAMQSLDEAAAIGDAIGFEPFRQYAEQLRQELESS